MTPAPTEGTGTGDVPTEQAQGWRPDPRCLGKAGRAGSCQHHHKVLPSYIPRAELHQHGNDSAHQSRGTGSNTIASSLPSSPPADSEAATDAGTRRQGPALHKTPPKIGKKKKPARKDQPGSDNSSPKIHHHQHRLLRGPHARHSSAASRHPLPEKVARTTENHCWYVRFFKKKSMDPVVFSMLLML